MFDKLLRKSKYSVDQNMQRLKMFKFIYNPVINRIKDECNKNPELNEKDIEDILYNELQEFLNDLKRISIKANVHCKIIKDDLRKNPVALRKAYEKAAPQVDEEYIKNIKEGKAEFQLGDYETSTVSLVKYFIGVLQIRQDAIIQHVSETIKTDYDTAEKKIKIVANMTVKQIKSLKLDKYVFHRYFRGTKFEQLEHWLIDEKITCQEQFLVEDESITQLDFGETVKRNCIKNIKMMIDFLNKYGIIDEKISRRKNMYQRFISSKTKNEEVKKYLQDLTYDKEEMLDLFSEENLKKMSVKQLLALNAEWSNITAKSINDINKMLFLIKQLGITNKIIHKEKIPSLEQIDKTTLRSAFAKIYIVNSLADKILDKITVKDIEIEDTTNEAMKMSNSYKDDYKEHFSIIFPDLDNEIIDDFNTYKAGEKIRSDLYKLKNDNMLALISEFQSDSVQPNWGICFINNKENIEDDEFVLVSFDINELMMPTGLHIPKTLLKDYMKCVHRSPDIRAYEGTKDFIIDGCRITTNGNCRMNAKYINALNKIVQCIDENDKIYDFIMHLNYIKDYQQYPKSMKEAKTKGNKTKYKKIVRYVDFDSEQVISQAGHEKLVKDFESKIDDSINTNNKNTTDVDEQEV